MPQFTYRKRTFLEPLSTGETAYILAEVESSQSGEYSNGTYMIVLADCKRHVEFEFYLGTAPHRKNSRAKIDLLVNTLTAFRTALEREAQLIEKGQ